MGKYSVWYDNEDQWDPNDIKEPVLKCKAKTIIAAAERVANDTDDNYAALIVRDEESGEYYQIALRRSWEVTRGPYRVTMAELSDEQGEEAP